MKTLARTLFIVLLALAYVGCDSNEPTDSEKIVGAWTVIKLEDGNGDQTATFADAVNSMVATYNSDNTYSLVVDYKLGTDVNISGKTYSVNETASGVTMNFPNPAGGADVPVPFTYNFVTDTQIELTVPAAALASIFPGYTGNIKVTANKN